MGYDATGNITSRSDIAGGATWTYDPVRKHAVTQAGSASYTYTYDGNGNASTRNGSTIGWTSYNYPDSVSTSTESATFDYGPDRQRWRMIYTGSSGIETTYYATPMFEEVSAGGVTDYRHYIYAGSRPVVVISRTTAGAINVRSLLADHQGSISSIVANSTGTSYVSESFTAYGNRREASTWSGAPTSGELGSMNGVTREGYTFQTVLGSMGLNHMNGRVQDAVTGRFLSPDPTSLSTGSTQTWNRYSYVANNPLTYTDPTGFKLKTYPYHAPGEVTSNLGGPGGHDRERPAHFGFGEGSIGSNWFGGVDADFAGSMDSGDDDDLTDVVVTATKMTDTSGSGDNGSAQGTNSNSSLDYIAITANYVDYDTNTGTVSTIPAGGGPVPGTGGLGTYVPFANSASVDPDRAYQALRQSDAAYAGGDRGEAARQMDTYFKYCGCSSGPAYNNMTFPPPPLSPQASPPTIAPPALPPIPLPSLPNVGP